MNFNDYIEDYCEGKLDQSKINAFEKTMIADPSLAAAVIKYREGKKVAEGLLELDIMETIDGLAGQDSDVGQEFREIKRRFLWRKIAAVAGIVGVGLVGWWMMQDSGLEAQKKKIWASYVKPIDSEAKKSDDTLSMNTFQLGKYFFSLNKFAQSEAKFELFVNETTVDDSLSLGYYWLGAACMEMWDVDGAKTAWMKSREEGVLGNLGLLENVTK